MRKIDLIEAAIAREQKHNNLLDCKIAALKVDIDNRQFTKDYLIHDKDLITRNERYGISISLSIHFY